MRDLFYTPKPEPKPDLVAKLIRLAGGDSDPWGEAFAQSTGFPALEESPYAFLYSPDEGWFRWTSRRGLHFQLWDQLAQEGKPRYTMPNIWEGRYFTNDDAQYMAAAPDIEIYDQRFHELPQAEKDKHINLIRLNSPGYTPKTAMAERSDDPELDALIEEYLQRGTFDWWSADGFDTNGDFQGDTWTRDELMQGYLDRGDLADLGEYNQGDLRENRDPDAAAGRCGDLAIDFRNFLRGRGVEADVLQTHPDTLYPDTTNILGYSGEEAGHAVTRVHLNGHTYAVDWTAAQYFQTEFPMVQKLDDQGQWQRKWASDWNELQPRGEWYEPVKPYVEEQAKYYHMCPACGGYLEKRGEDVYTCQKCPYEISPETT